MAGDECGEPGADKRVERSRLPLLRAITFDLVIVIVNVAALEIFLRAADFSVLRVAADSSLRYAHDPELGWAPVPNAQYSDTAQGFRQLC
jgi:hypothetical protein